MSENESLIRQLAYNQEAGQRLALQMEYMRAKLMQKSLSGSHSVHGYRTNLGTVNWNENVAYIAGRTYGSW
jgi:hypothetical protein